MTVPDRTRRGVSPSRPSLEPVSYPRGPYPAGYKSTPGLFKGYPFNTYGTRIGKQDLTVPLSVLGKYAHVVWIVDGEGARNDMIGKDPNEPMTALRYMSQAGKVNTFAAYVKQGGMGWLTGGGGAYASMFPRGDRDNDHPTTTFPSVKGPKFDLLPGTFMCWVTLARVHTTYTRADSDVLRSTVPKSSGLRLRELGTPTRARARCIRDASCR